MAGGQPVGARGWGKTTNPTHFSHATDTTFFHKKTNPEVQMYDGESNASGVTVYSQPLRIAPAEGFSVYSSGTGDVDIQVGVNPDTGIWVTIDTLTDVDLYTTVNNHAWLRIGLQTGVSNMTVWIYRKYRQY